MTSLFVSTIQVKQLKMAVDELTIEISNNSEMYDFIRLKKEIYSAYLDLSRKFDLLKCVEEPILNLRAVDNLNQVKNAVAVLMV